MKAIVEKMLKERASLQFDDADELLRFIKVFISRWIAEALK